MSNPFTFITVAALIACALVMVIGALFGGDDESAVDPKDTEIAALEAELREMKRRAALEGGGR